MEPAAAPSLSLATRAIVCGVDLSVAADDAAAVAAGLAQRFGDRLVLVHATPIALHDDGPLARVLRQTLDDQVRGLASRGVDVGLVVEDEPVARLLPRVASEQQARLLVVWAGQAAGHQRGIGTTARAIADATDGPVLLVQDADVLAQWLSGARTLRVVVAAAFDDALPALRDMVCQLRGVGAVDVVVVHTSFPRDESRRLGGPPPAHLIENDLAVETLVRSELATQFRDLPGEGTLTVLITPGLGRTDSHIFHAAADVSADVVVIGSHRRQGLDRLRHGATDAGLLRLARGNVLVVPSP